MIKTLNTISVYILPFIIGFILIYSICKKSAIYEDFIEGAKEGFNISVKIIPYLVAIMVAVSMFRNSGAIDLLQNLVKPVLDILKIPVETFIIFITRSLSGSATLGVLSDIINQTGPNSYATKLAAVITGSSETTFYVAAVYFGSVGIKKYRHALPAGILADLTGIVLALVVCRIFFG